MFAKLFKKHKTFRKGGLHVDPNICWNYILVVSVLITLGAFILGFLLWRDVSREPQDASMTNSAQVEAVSKGRINASLEYFHGRLDKSLKILENSSPVVDPS